MLRKENSAMAIRKKCKLQEKDRQDLRLPVFSGEHVFGWIHKVERKFWPNTMSDREKLHEALKVLEDRALIWFCGWKESNPLATWMEFKVAVVQQFNQNSKEPEPEPELDLESMAKSEAKSTKKKSCEQTGVISDPQPLQKSEVMVETTMSEIESQICQLESKEIAGKLIKPEEEMTGRKMSSVDCTIEEKEREKLRTNIEQWVLTSLISQPLPPEPLDSESPTEATMTELVFLCTLSKLPPPEPPDSKDNGEKDEFPAALKPCIAFIPAKLPLPEPPNLKMVVARRFSYDVCWEALLGEHGGLRCSTNSADDGFGE